LDFCYGCCDCFGAVVAHGGIYAGISVVSERVSANCRVVVGSGVVRGVIKDERVGTYGGVIKGISIERKRVIAKGAVVVAVDVAEKRESAKSVVAVGYIGTARVIIIERKAADSSVVAGDGVEDERIRSNGRVAT